jgi:hypothetical protein
MSENDEGDLTDAESLEVLRKWRGSASARVKAEPYLPERLGFEALNELDRVDWSTLNHAFGQGVTAGGIGGDVPGSLALLADDPLTALNDGLWCNICHQGTVYEATAYAIPFVAAVAAGDVPSDLRAQLTDLLGYIALNGSFVAPSGSHSGSHGDGVDALIRRTIIRGDDYLTSIEQFDEQLSPIVGANRLVTIDPSDENRDTAEQIIDPRE